MRGSTARQVTMLALVDPDQLIPADHPIGDVKPIVETALKELILAPKPTARRLVRAVVSRVRRRAERCEQEVGRRSIPPEHLLKAYLLMAFYSIRSERQFCERLRYAIAI